MRLLPTSEKTQRLVVTLGLGVLIVIGAVVAMARSTAGPQEVFWGAVKNSLSANAVTIESSQKTATTSLQTASQLDFGQHPATLTLTTLSSGNAEAKTEALTTPSAQYIRYDSIHKLVKGHPVNFKNVIGVWAKTASYHGDVVPPTYSQVLLDQLLPLPIGNLTRDQQAQLLQEIQDNQVYTPNFSSATKQTYAGRSVYVYKVTIQPVLYLQLIKDYAPFLDMHQIDKLNPNSYAAEPAVTARWTIDAYSKELLQVDYGNGRVQTYSGWDTSITTQVPAHAVSGSTLEQRLGALL